MPSNLEVILGNMGVRGADRLRGSATIDFQAAKVGLDPQYAKNAQMLTSIGDAFGSGMNAWNQYKDTKTKTGTERADYLMQHFTPEELQNARKNGQMLYQDDPYAMKALNLKIGQTVSMDVDGEIQSRIQNGEFKTRKELDVARAEAMNQSAKAKAEAYGADFANQDFQLGMNSQVTERNIALYGTHDKWLDNYNKNKATLQNRSDTISLIGDRSFLENAQAPQTLFTHLQQSANLAGQTPEEQNRNTQATLLDIANRPGGLAFLNNAEKGDIQLANGTKINPKSYVSEEQWQGMKIAAAGVQQKLDASKAEDFQLGIASSINDPDPNNGLITLQKVKAQENLDNPTGMLTANRQAIIDAEVRINRSIAEANAQKAKQQTKEAQATNKNYMLDDAYTKRLQGGFVSTSVKDMPSNDSTGEWTQQDAVNYANWKLGQIDRMELPESQKDNYKMQLLAKDDENGPFRSQYSVLVNQAQREWDGMIAQGKENPNHPAIDQLRKAYQADPELISQLYPEKAVMFGSFSDMDTLGLTMEQSVLGAAQAKSQTKEMRFEADKQWADSKNDSKYPDLSRIPTTLDAAARKVFDAELFKTGNSDSARQKTSDFLKGNVKVFKGKDTEGEALGVIPSNMLRVTGDPKSADEGFRLIDTHMQTLKAENPWITDKDLTIRAEGRNLVINDSTGQIRQVITPESLKQEYTNEQNARNAEATKAAEAKADQMMKDANKRAPIAAVSAAKKQAAERKLQKARKVPKNIYGGQNEVIKDLGNGRVKLADGSYQNFDGTKSKK